MERLPKLIATLLEPRNMLLAAMSVAAVGFFVSYGDVQDEADRVLALHQGPPEARNIQDFRPGRDVGPAGEIRLRGEVRMAAAVTLQLPAASGQWVTIVPVFPISDAGRALLADHEADDEAVLTAQMQRRATEPEAAAAVGIVLVPVAGPEDAPDTPAAFAEADTGAGLHGTLVTLNGNLRDAGPVGLVAYGAFAARGVPLSADAVTVVPFLQGRVAALSAPVSNRGAHMLFLTAWALAFVAALMKFAQEAGALALRRRSPEDDTTAFVPPPPGQHPKFAPIPSQGEILAADRVDAELAVPPHPLVVFLIKLGVLRNRPSRRGAEAP